MNLHDLVNELIIDTKGSAEGGLTSIEAYSSLGVFGPEILLCILMVLILLVRLIRGLERFDVFYLALVGSVLALVVAEPWRLVTDPASFQRMEIFTGMLVYDGFTVFIRGILLVFAVLFILFTKLSGIPDREDGPDIYTLVLGSTLGMCLMASANHLMTIFLAVEMASVPSYVLAGMLKGRRQGSEAALKYSVYGAGAAGVMLYGISLIAGVVNTAHLPTIAQTLANMDIAAMMLEQSGSGQLVALAFGGLLLGVGLAFKLSAVPFHFWCPDVFEGASAEVGAFLSVASKAAALALLVRVAVGFGTLAPAGHEPGVPPNQNELAVSLHAGTGSSDGTGDHESHGLFNVDEESSVEPNPVASGSDQDLEVEEQGTEALAPVRNYIAQLVAFIAIITCTFGNLAAYGQTNIKRLFAYSTIAHAGYMMMAVPPMLALVSVGGAGASSAVAALGIYIAIYLFMNLGAFVIVAFLRNEMRSEEIADYSGLIRRCPGVVICLSLILFSLVGLPPLAGFVGKFAVFAAVAESYQATGATYLAVLLAFGGLNTAISLFYYLRIVKVMVMEPEPDDRQAFVFPLASLAGGFVFLLTLPTIILMLNWEWLSNSARTAAQHLFT